MSKPQPVDIDLNPVSGKVSFNVRGIYALIVSLIITFVPFVFILFAIKYLNHGASLGSSSADPYSITPNQGYLKVISIFAVTFLGHAFYFFIFNMNSLAKYVVLTLLFFAVAIVNFIINKYVYYSIYKDDTLKIIIESVLYALFIVLLSLFSFDRALCIYDYKKCKENR
jgi:magnesium-transporting ATPase (P-type)